MMGDIGDTVGVGVYPHAGFFESLSSLRAADTEGGSQGRRMPDFIESPTSGTMSAAISNATVRLLAEYTGRGPTKARTTLTRDSVTVLLADTLTKGERKLVEHGESDTVLASRHRVQLIMRDDLVAAVEKVVDRKVIAFMSSNHIDPDMAVEVFALEPEPGDDSGERHEALDHSPPA